MNPTHWSAHAKHIAIAIIAAVGVCGALAVRGKYETMVADRMAKRDEQIAVNQAKVAELQKGNKTDENAITARDLQNAADIARLKAQASQPLTASQVDAIIAARLAGANPVKGKDAQGNETVTLGTGYLADTLNKAAINQQICDKNFSTCEADKANLNNQIGRQADIIATHENTIKIQDQQLADMKKFVVPRWTLGIGVSKAPGASFQSANSYQPNFWANYRAFGRVGVWAGVQDKSLAGGVSFAVGGVPK